MRVLFIVPQPFFADRGGPFRTRATAVALADAGYKVDLLVFAPGEKVEIPGVTIHRTWQIPLLSSVPIGASTSKALYDILLFLMAVRFALFRRYHLLHGVEEGGFMACILGLLTGVPYIFEMYSSMPEQLRQSRSRFRQKIASVFAISENYTVKHAATVVTMTEACVPRLKRIAPLVPLHCLRGVSLGPYAPPDANYLQNLLQSSDLKGRRIILYTGNSAQYQGLDLLLRSFAAFLRKHPGTDSEELVLLLVGGAEMEAERWERYRLLAMHLGIESKVILTGQRPGESLSAYLAVAELVVSPRSEGHDVPFKLYSYMAAGTPILATRLPCHTKVLSDDNAILAEPTLEQFSAALSQALDPSEKAVAVRHKLALNARELAETRYSGQEYSRALRSLYARILNTDSKFPGNEDDRQFDVEYRKAVKSSLKRLLSLLHSFGIALALFPDNILADFLSL